MAAPSHNGIRAAPAWEEAVAAGIPTISSVLVGFISGYVVAILFSNHQVLNTKIEFFSVTLASKDIAIPLAFLAIILNLIGIERSIVCRAKDTSKLAKPEEMTKDTFENHLKHINGERALAAKIALGSVYSSLPVAFASLAILTSGVTFKLLIAFCGLWLIYLSFSFIKSTGFSK